MPTDDPKQFARKRRERNRMLWLTTFSWSTPMFAFGGFFTLWHHMGSGTTHHVQKTAATVSQTAAGTSSVLFGVGSNSQNVVVIQEGLAQLGYFDHAVTGYYGQVTADAVRSFQTDKGLPVTGNIDRNTLLAMQQALKQHQMVALSGSNGDSNGNQTTDNSGNGQDFGSGSVGFGQQSTPSGMTSAS